MPKPFLASIRTALSRLAHTLLLGRGIEPVLADTPAQLFTAPFDALLLPEQTAVYLWATQQHAYRHNGQPIDP